MIDTQTWTIPLVYQNALKQQLTGVMFHHDSYHFFEYFGLPNLAMLQYKRYEEESKAFDDIIETYLVRHDMLLDGKTSEFESIIPNEVYTTKASSVGNEYKRKILNSFMITWANREEKAESLYQAIVSWCVNNQQADAHFFSKMVMAVCAERQMIHCLNSCMATYSYDITHAEKTASEMQ